MAWSLRLSVVFRLGRVGSSGHQLLNVLGGDPPKPFTNFGGLNLALLLSSVFQLLSPLFNVAQGCRFAAR